MDRRELKENLEKNLKKTDFEKNAELDIAIDFFFGLDFKTISNLSPECYPDLPNVALSTPYSDYYQILNDIEQGETLLDIGAGYCRGSLLSSYLNLNKCRSVEVVEYRVEQGRNALSKLGGDLSLINNADLIQELIEPADNYYLYFAKGRVFYKILRDIVVHAYNQDQKIYVCESHGDILDFFFALKNIEKIGRLKSSAKRHCPYIYKFLIRSMPENLDITQDLVSWFLMNFDKKLCVEFEYYHLTMKQTVKTLCLLEDLDLVFYKNKWSLSHQYSNRIYEFEEFTITNMIDYSKIDTKILEKLQNREVKKSKLLLVPQPLIEGPSGQREFI